MAKEVKVWNILECWLVMVNWSLGTLVCVNSVLGDGFKHFFTPGGDDPI